MAGKAEKPSADLFNFNDFDGKLKDRVGSEKDVSALRKRLSTFCTVQKHFDCYTSDFISKLQNIAGRDHSNSKYIFIYISSHGVAGEVIFTRDGSMSISEIMRYFSHVQCPKIFMIQACRGETYDDGVSQGESDPLGIDGMAGTDDVDYTGIDDRVLRNFNVKPRAFNTSVVSMSSRIPLNTLLLYSTPPNRYSWRGRTKGGYYVQTFIRQLKTMMNDSDKSSSPQIDLTRLVVKTHKDLAENFSSTARSAPEKRQVGHFISTLYQPVFLDA